MHSLDHFGLRVPDLSEAAAFYGAFGLNVRARDGGLDLYAPGVAHCWGRLVQGARKQIGHLSFGAYAQDFARFEARADALKLQRAAIPASGTAEGLWLRDPDGTPVQIRVAEKPSPDGKTPFEMRSSPAGVAGAPTRAHRPRVHPLRLSHVALFCRDVNAQLEFYCNVLGLRLADRSGDDLAFLCSVHGSDHHIVAFLKSDHAGLHHCSWDMGSVENIEYAAMQMAEQGYGAGWGLGRHVLGSNYFHYIRDPWGSFAECLADIDYVPAEMNWQAGNHPQEDAFYLWGPPPPENFARNYEEAV